MRTLPFGSITAQRQVEAASLIRAGPCVVGHVIEGFDTRSTPTRAGATAGSAVGAQTLSSLRRQLSPSADSCTALECWNRLALQVVFDEGRELRPADRTHLGGDWLTVLEQHQCRDATDVVLAGGLRVLVDVELGDAQAPGVARS